MKKTTMISRFNKDVEDLLDREDVFNSPEYIKDVKKCEYVKTEKKVKKGKEK